MPTSLTIRINNTINESSFVAQPSYYVSVDTLTDYFIFSGGSVLVADGQPVPLEADLNRAGVQLDPLNEVIVSKYLLADISANLLKEVKNAGNQTKRFAFCCSFGGATASEPQLEAWDDDDLDSYLIAPLGGGIPTISWFRAICTTTSTPLADWVGIKLGGEDASNVVLLNDGVGPLTVATDLYFNFKIVIPTGVTTPGSYTPVLNITYLTN